MKNIFFALAAFTIAIPTMADSGEVPGNFDEAILRESAADQGVETNTSKFGKATPVPKLKHKAVHKIEKSGADAAKKKEDLPAGFEEAILRESAADQGIDTGSKKIDPMALPDVGPVPKSRPTKKTKDMKKLIAAFIKYNELHGDEQPATEEECVEASLSQVELSACLEVLGLRSSVLSSRQVAGKKTPGAHDSESHGDTYMEFKKD